VRQKTSIIGAFGVGVVLITGLIFSVFLSYDHVDDQPAATDSSSGDFATSVSRGHVVTSDTPASGKPKQDVRDNDQLAVIAKTQQTIRAVTPNEERYITINNKVYPLRTYEALSMPSDTYADQWWVHNTTLPDMWDLPPGPLQTTLAIIDTGFALSHEEFQNRWYENGGEVGITTDEGPSLRNCTDRGLSLDQACNLVDDNVDGIVDNESGSTSYQNPSQLNCTDRAVPLDKRCNRLDDDANSLIDDVTGWDFVDNHSSVQAGKLNPNGGSTTHGTMVAGVAAATGGNAKGIAGVDWRTKVLPIQALDDDGYGDTRTVGDAIFYAVDQGADVIGLSLGTEAPDSYVREAIEAATAEGTIVIAAAGNDGCACLLYPAGDPEVLAVGALGTDGLKAGFSSWGGELDIMAPGSNMTLPSWSSANPTARYTSDAAGTSFAAPLVAGVASVMRSYSADTAPLHVIAALTEQATRANSGVFDSQYGFGSMKALAAVNRMTIPQETPQNYTFTPVHAGTYYTPTTPLETPSSYLAQDCVQGIASTPVYELKKSSQHFFSMSRVEVHRAIASGHSASLFTYACQQLPHDQPINTRNINIFSEFRNIYRKL
jgi:subtilisin family serine protease